MRYILLLTTFLLIACDKKQPEVYKIEGNAQGTTFHISYWSETPVDNNSISQTIQSTLEDIDLKLSNYRPDSHIEGFNSNPETTSVSADSELVELIKISNSVYQASQGCFDLTVKPLFDLWGFKSESLTIPSNEVLQETLQHVGMNKVLVVDETHLQKTDPLVRVDVSAVAQGYSVGRLSNLLEQFGVTNYLVEIGGELKTNGHRTDGQAWKIALEKPLPGERRVNKIISMPKDAPMAIMTSGTYRHFYELNGQRYSHILDARIGKPVSHDLVSVAVMHEDPTMADAWSTALLCLGPSDGMKLANSEKLNAIFIRLHGSELLETRSEVLKTATNLSIQ